jgi:hypothetical protein
MKPTEILVVTHWEDGDLIVMSRVKGSTGQAITPTDLGGGTVECKVFDRLTRAQIGATQNPAAVSVLFDTLQLDDRWSVDAEGYNFRYTVPGTLFPDGNKTYRVECRALPSVGQGYPLAMLDVETEDRFGG